MNEFWRDFKDPLLKYNQADYFDVWESDLSEFVSKLHGRPWSLQQGQMLGQNTYVDVVVDPEGPDYYTPEEALEKLSEWLEYPDPETDFSRKLDFIREKHLDVEIVMWDLCRRKLIQPGKYHIRVWW